MPTGAPEPEPSASFLVDAAAAQGLQVNQGGFGNQQNTFYLRPRPPVSWPQRVGAVPTLASAYQERAGLRARIEAGLAGTSATVLTQVLAGGGGVGKSQLAASYAAEALRTGVELVVWVNATGTDSVVAAYAQTAARIQAPGADGSDPQADARALLDWLATTERTWLVVLDDITEPERIGRWWPVSHTGAGRVLATTRRREAVLSDGGRTVIEVDVYDETESNAYLTERFRTAGAPQLLDAGAAPLAEALGHLPLALSHAAAYMINESVGCAAYLGLFGDRRSHLDAVMPANTDPSGWNRSIAATLLVALDAAQDCAPVGLALPALRLAAVLDPAGHPDTLWTDPDVSAYLNRYDLLGSGGVTVAQARAAMRLLHRYGLTSHDPQAGPRAVRIHALTARAARETTPPAELDAAMQAAADALLTAWPDSDTHPQQADLVAALRSNTDILIHHRVGVLWQPNTHLLLLRAGGSLLDAGLHHAAAGYWQHLADVLGQLLGDRHPNTLTARIHLADAHRQAGRTDEAIVLQERVVAERERIFGDRHPHTLTARADLALSYWQAGRLAEAIVIEERMVEDTARVLGPGHPNALTARTNLAVSYRHTGRVAEAITMIESVIGDLRRVHGDQHPSTLGALANLATCYREVGRVAEAIVIHERVLADSEQVLGDGHPDTVTARMNLAASYRQAGRTAEATTIVERVAVECHRVFGDRHPNTLSARANLAIAYHETGRVAEGLTMLERVVADSTKIFGDRDRRTVDAASLLRSWTSGG